MIVVDAPVVIDLLLGVGSPAGDAVAGHLRDGEELGAPHLVDAEVGQGIRRFVLHGDLTDTEAESMIADFLDVSIKRYRHTGLLPAAFDFRSNVTVHDGLYLALAETLDCPLLTGDAALENDCRAQVEVLAPQPLSERRVVSGNPPAVARSMPRS